MEKEDIRALTQAIVEMQRLLLLKESPPLLKPILDQLVEIDRRLKNVWNCLERHGEEIKKIRAIEEKLFRLQQSFGGAENDGQHSNQAVEETKNDRKEGNQ